MVIGEGGRAVQMSGIRLRVLLAALLVHANRPVAVDELAEFVWDGAPPAQAVRTMRSHVMRLRRALGDAGADWIVTRDRGYLCQVGHDELDTLRFEGLCGQAGAAVRGGQWAQASDAATAALALWRGAPLGDIPSQGLRDGFVARLEQLRLQVLEDEAEAGLHVGRHEELVPGLLELTAAHPLRERFHVQLMTALSRVGRRAEALDAYRRARRVLVEELGVEPGPELRRLHERILTGDDRTAEPAAIIAHGHVTLGAGRPVPRQLPTTTRHFTGRDAELSLLTKLACDPLDTVAGAVAICTIDGMAGVGKTALALHWAHLHADRFPDGQLYVDLRGFGPSGTALSAAAAVRRLLGALGVLQDHIPVGLAAQCALYRSTLADRRMLIVLDNARDAEQVRPLLPGSAGCMVLITSRDRLSSLAALEGAHSLVLNPLPADDAHVLLTRRLGAGRVAAEPWAVNILIDMCARLPLALNIVAARACANPDLPLAALVDQLRDTRDRLTMLEAGDAAANVRAVLSWSYRALTGPAARMFRLLAGYPGPDLSVAAAASLAAVSREQARHALQELANVHLLTEQTPGRHSFVNDLVSVYAAEQAHAQEPEEERRAALHRALEHCLHGANNAAALLGTSGAPAAPPRPGVIPEQHPDSRHALAWLDAEHHILIAATARAADAGFDTHAWQLTTAVAGLLGQYRHWHDLADTLRIGLRAAERLGDRNGQALAHHYLGLTLAGLGDYREAYTHFGRALALARSGAGQGGPRQAEVHLGIAYALDCQHHHRQAHRHIGQSLALARAAGDRVAQAAALKDISVHHCRLGDFPQALACARQALDLLRDADEYPGEAAVWSNRALAHHHLGQYDESIACYDRALGLYRQAHNRHGHADTLIRLGNTHQRAGNTKTAHDTWQEALTILEQIQHPRAEELRRSLAAQPDQIALRTGQVTGTCCDL
ncbi:AfsR/SARP family transcriptional regulator [Actinocrinis sp.]|uniref:AfsR/SARP family transcriptional regulator n=1 Tax=Actinocrinis sp. TaxID=1920516 RepID=UPI002DDCDC6C|nr:BTAD domain-containing putative transcriptional regulator [Actinocrinis sp.]